MHEADQPDLSLTSWMPTFWPAKSVLKLILRRPQQMRPQRVTITVWSWKV